MGNESSDQLEEQRHAGYAGLIRITSHQEAGICPQASEEDSDFSLWYFWCQEAFRDVLCPFPTEAREFQKDLKVPSSGLAAKNLAVEKSGETSWLNMNMDPVTQLIWFDGEIFHNSPIYCSLPSGKLT